MIDRNYYMIITTPKSCVADIKNNFGVIGFSDRNLVKNFRIGNRKFLEYDFDIIQEKIAKRCQK
ncbi:MAG: hypothetical protein GXW85_01815 [Clostridia bacterium]|nr:hypothetical protein [Clostridia bacterium]